MWHAPFSSFFFYRPFDDDLLHKNLAMGWIGRYTHRFLLLLLRISAHKCRHQHGFDIVQYAHDGIG